ncbi:Metallo-dependent phosphatase-like [Sesbania bispinosa]|nr:Metallo-dependent phosphatase-like [Sesbania bispinosa]
MVKRKCGRGSGSPSRGRGDAVERILPTAFARQRRARQLEQPVQQNDPAPTEDVSQQVVYEGGDIKGSHPQEEAEKAREWFFFLPSLGKNEANELLVTLLGVSYSDATADTEYTQGPSVRLSWLRSVYENNVEQNHLTYVARAYLLHLGGCTIFVDKSVSVVQVQYLELFRLLALVGQIAWGAVALTYLYEQLNEASLHQTRQLAGYSTLFQGECIHGYLDWFRLISHPYLIPHEDRFHNPLPRRVSVFGGSQNISSGTLDDSSHQKGKLVRNYFTKHMKNNTASLSTCAEERVIEVKGGPDSVVWVVQLSDLHFSVHHPDRALDFNKYVGPALSMINPSLVLITGDLTDGKSKDLLTMKQNEDEWVEYRNVMDAVVESSGLHKSLFFDLRGNHDNFGVPVVGGSFDFFSKYSINGQLGRNGSVNSVTLETQERKHLFVGIDTTMSAGLRGPTNLFGHPTDQLLRDLDLELSHWDSQSEKPVTKISFGHFPLSFSAPSSSGRTLEDVFLKHSISAYLCGHLHTKFGKNLKRHHQLSNSFLSLHKFFQFNIHQNSFESAVNCSLGAPQVQEFWEWEMGDWRKNRVFRILAIDKGHVSHVDVDFKFKSEAKHAIILPTFPLDSRFMLTSLCHHNYECQSVTPSSYETIRALVFSVSPVASVVARVYDSRSGNLDLVVETYMTKHADENSRGNLYVAPWNYKAFENASPDRFWLQIEAIDKMSRSTLTELRPFSINGHSIKLSWSWKEFLVMGCQWASLYYPLFWSALYFMFFFLLLPKALLVFKKNIYTYKNFANNKGLVNGVLWVLQELCRVRTLWFGWIGYLLYLILFPWFMGQVFTEGKNMVYMTYMGWAVETSNGKGKLEYVGSPDIMVVVLPHLLFVVLPAILVTSALTAERAIYREHMLAFSGKKKDDLDLNSRRSLLDSNESSILPNFHLGKRGIRKLLCVLCLAICWKHFMNCRTLLKAYEMNPVLHFLGYGLSIPLLLAIAISETRSAQ